MYRPQLSSPPQAYSSSQCLGSQAYPSNPVQDNSPVKDVVPVKRKYTKRLQQSKKKDKDSNEPWSPKEEIALYKSWVNVFDNIIDEKTEESHKAIRPMGRLMANRKTSSATSRSESPSHGEHGLVQVLLNKWKNIATPLFFQRKEASDEYLRIKERQLKPEQ
ncbi:hypothetical protein Tco_1052507 [Tanacetum coccineum]